MHIRKRTLSLLLALGLTATALPIAGLAADASGSGSDTVDIAETSVPAETAETAGTVEASETHNPTTDEEIQAALETYDPLIDDPEYQKAYEAHQTWLEQQDSPQTYAAGANPYTGKTYTHKHAKTTYIYNGIDVSKWQGTINWKKVKADGIDFVLIHCGSTSTKQAFNIIEDTYFDSNIKNAYAAGIKVGVYYYSGATSASEAKQEANYVLKLINPYKSMITLPVFMDYETDGSSDRIAKNYSKTGTNSSSGKTTRTAYVTNFCSPLVSAGYQGGIYASRAWLTDFFNMSSLTAYSTWVADWNPSTPYAYAYDFWQYSASGTINGISGAVDCDFWYTNTSLSGSTTTTTTASTLLTPYFSTIHLNYRTGCGTNYTAKGKITKGAAVNVVYGWSKTVNGEKWYKVKVGSTYYYCMAKYLSREVLVNYSPTIKLNYRTGCGTNYTVKGKLTKGGTAQIVKGWSKKAGGETWYKVKVGSSYYYCMAKYLKKQETITIYTTKAKVNVRSDAGTDKTLITSLLGGTPVSVIAGGTKTVSGPAWYKVKINTSYYYMMASYLTK